MVKIMPFVFLDLRAARLVQWFYSWWRWFQPFYFLSPNFGWGNWNVCIKIQLSMRNCGTISVFYCQKLNPGYISLFKILSHVYSDWSHCDECCKCRCAYSYRNKEKSGHSTLKSCRWSVFVLFGVWDREAVTGHLFYKRVCTVATLFILKCYSRVFNA